MKLSVLALSAALGVSISSVAYADCLDAATNAVEQKGFTVKEGALEDLVFPQNSGGVNGYRAWLRVARCDNGHVVVNMQSSCRIQQIWATGGCDVPEIEQALQTQP